MIKCDILPPKEVWDLINNGCVLLDVRSIEEYKEGALMGAINIPHSELEKRMAELSKYRDQTIIAYCANGPRSEFAKNYLLESGFGQVYNGGGYKNLSSFKQE